MSGIGLTNRAIWTWIAGYLLLISVTVFWLWSARQSVLASLANDAAQAEWREFKAEVIREQNRSDTPVDRRPPTSDEPPSLILLRDHFGGIVFGSLVVLSFLYAFVVFVVQGAMRGSQPIWLEPRTRPDA